MANRNYIGSISKDGIVYGITTARTLVAIDGQYTKDPIVALPACIGDMKVVAVGEKAFSNSPVHTVMLPDTVTTIEHHAFDGCPKLQLVVFGASVVYLGHKAFANCGKLKQVEGHNLRTVSDCAFWKCQNLGKIYAFFETEVFSKTFGSCEMLTEVFFANNVKIHKDVFWGCKRLKTLFFESNVIASEEVMKDIAKRRIVCKKDSPLVDLSYSGTNVNIKLQD